MTGLLDLAASAGGRALSAAVAVGGRVRPTRKPLHPHGLVTAGRLHRYGSPQTTGVPWLDDEGEDDVVVRISRGAGMPDAWPDVLGLALRIDITGDSYADLLFATTGTSPLGRFLLRPVKTVTSGRLTTLLPYRSPSGPLLLGARVAGDALDGEFRADLELATPTGPWHRFAEVIGSPPEHEPARTISFDPVLHPVPGLEPYRWVTLLRERAYAAARHTRAA